jgi:hypothetical protein
MRHRIKLVCLALMLAGAAARADILPEPDRGPPMATVGGLDFAIQSVEVKYPPGYTKTLPVVVLTGCTDGHRNCELARSKNLIGMEVLMVDGEDLRPENGRVQQIVDAFERKSAAKTVTLELYSRGSGSESIKVSFARR